MEMAFKLDDGTTSSTADYKKFKTHPDMNMKNLLLLSLEHAQTDDPRNSWKIQIKKLNSFNPEEGEDILVVFNYTVGI
jgi:hypothetical protein